MYNKDKVIAMVIYKLLSAVYFIAIGGIESILLGLTVYLINPNATVYVYFGAAIIAVIPMMFIGALATYAIRNGFYKFLCRMSK